jgi:two-component system, NtrC family, sensor histidine kinase KinB
MDTKGSERGDYDDADGSIVASNPLARSVLKATGVESAQRIADLPLPAPSLGAVEAALRGERGNETRAEFSRALAVSLDGRRSKFMFTVIPIPEFREGRFGAVAILYDVTDFARLVNCERSWSGLHPTS